MRRSISVLVLALVVMPVLAQDPPFVSSWGTTGSGSGEWTLPMRFEGVPSFQTPEQIYVVDRPAGRIQSFLTDGTLVREWDAATTALVDPVAVAAEPVQQGAPGSGKFYVLDAGADAVLTFEHTGAFLGSFPVQAFDDGDLALDVSWAHLAIVMTDRHAVMVYTLDGVVVRTVGQYGVPGDGSFLRSPYGIARIADDEAWVVTDSGNDRLVVLDVDSGLLGEYGSFGSGAQQFDVPLGITVDCRGDALVADNGNQRVQRVNVRRSFVSGSVDFTPLPAWFEGEGFDVVDVGVALDDGIAIVGLAVDTEDERAAFIDDVYLLTGVASRTVRRYQGEECCVGFGIVTVNVETNGGDLLVTPAGTGPTVGSMGGAISVQILDGCDEPIAGYPFQDVFLGDTGAGTLNVCPGGSVADGNTNANGETTISGTIAAGGSSVEGLRLFIGGSPVDDLLPFRVVSPDINADRIVNLSDVAEFAAAYSSGSVPFEADLNFDGLMNLSDVAVFVAAVGETCP